MMNPIGPGGNRPNVRASYCLNYRIILPQNKTGHFNGVPFLVSQFPMGPGPDGPMGGMGGMEQHHMNGSLGECSKICGDSFVSGFSPPEPSLSQALTRTYFYSCK